MLYREIIAVRSEFHKKNTLFGHNAKFLDAKPGGRQLEVVMGEWRYIPHIPNHQALDTDAPTSF